MPVKILLADKSITIQKVVEMLFSGREYEVHCVSDGEAAINDAIRLQPDIVLADVDLPRIDGYTLSTSMKQTPEVAEIPVILMMSRDDVYDSAKGKLAGIVDNIAKPFESQELISKVKKAIAAAPPRLAAPAQPIPIPAPRAAESAASSKQAPPANIFDIIQEAPTEQEVRRVAPPATPDAAEYIVEAEVEEVDEPLVQEVEKALPVGQKAVDEMRAGLGLTEEIEQKADIISLEAFEEALQPAPTPPVEAPSTREAKPADEPELFQPKPAQTPITAGKEDAVAAQTTPKHERAVPAMPLSESDLWGIAEDTIAKMAKDMFAKMPTVQPPHIPEEKVLSMVEKKVAQLVEEAFAKLPPITPPKISEDAVRKIAEDHIAKLSASAMQNIKLPEPPKLSEKELRGMAETTLSVMAADIFKSMPPPPMPKVTDETVRRGLEAVLSKIAREMAKEVIEQVAWEVIPPLAEQYVKAEIERLRSGT
ncbi:MAG TPA: response regulator [Nitrospirota bacterium]|nr:response regulator [Nitrospirota bacterium]